MQPPLRRLTYLVACTADRFIAGLDGSWDFFLPPKGKPFDDVIADFPETIPGHLRDHFGVRGDNKLFDTVLMGRSTYEVGLKEGITSPYPHLRQYVFSGSMGESLDPAVTVVSGDPIAEVRRLKAETPFRAERRSGGSRAESIWLCGGGKLASAIHSEIDELILKIHPVVIGAGIPLFANVVQPMQLELLESRSYPDGFVRAHYRRSTTR